MITLGSSSMVSPGIWLAVILGGLLVVFAFGGKADIARTLGDVRC
jgi:hypothetical protein